MRKDEDGEAKLNTNPDPANLLEDGEEKYAYYSGGKIAILYGPKIIFGNNKKQYLYLVNPHVELKGDKAKNDVWEALLDGNLKLRQYVSVDRDKIYAEMLASYAAFVAGKMRKPGIPCGFR